MSAPFWFGKLFYRPKGVCQAMVKEHIRYPAVKTGVDQNPMIIFSDSDKIPGCLSEPRISGPAEKNLPFGNKKIRKPTRVMDMDFNRPFFFDPPDLYPGQKAVGPL